MKSHAGLECRIFILLCCAGLLSCVADPPPVATARKNDSFTLRLATDRALFLDEKPIDPRNLAQELARIADRLRVDAKLAGEPIIPDHGLSARIVYQADGELPFSEIYGLALQAQSAGFLRYSFILDSEAPNPSEMNRVESSPSRIVRNGNGDLPVELRTIPIRLIADDRGKAVRLELAERGIPDFEALRVELASILNEPGTSFDRVFLIIDPGLDFAEVVRVVNLIASLNIGMIDLKEANPG
jgi:biopolymer transport protein ExbD